MLLANFQDQRTRVANVMVVRPTRAGLQQQSFSSRYRRFAVFIFGPKTGKSMVGLVPKCYFQHDTWVTTLIDNESTLLREGT